MKASRLLVGAFCAASFTLAGAGVVSAGEVNGNGDETPPGRYDVPASICSFSGLNDDPNEPPSEEDPFAPGKVQSFGDIVQEVSKSAKVGGPSAKEKVGLIKAFGPSQSCNKNAGGEGH